MTPSDINPKFCINLYGNIISPLLLLEDRRSISNAIFIPYFNLSLIDDMASFVRLNQITLDIYEL